MHCAGSHASAWVRIEVRSGGHGSGAHCQGDRDTPERHLRERRAKLLNKSDACRANSHPLDASPCSPKLILQCGRSAYPLPEIKHLVERFLADGVQLVAIVGLGCATMEELIDELVVADAADPSRFVLTSSHPDESLEEVIEFVHTLQPPGDPQIIMI